MENGKSSAGTSVLNAILILLNLAFLVWIIFSWRAQREAQPAESYQNGADYGASGLLSGSEDPSSAFSSSAGWPGENGTSDDPSADPADGSDDRYGSTQDSSPNSAQGTSQDSSLNNAQDGAPVHTQPAVSYDTAERPESSDFQTWYEHNVTGSIPTGARTITDFEEIKGSWKALFRYSESAASAELLNMSVSGTPSSASLTADWYMIVYSGDGEWMNEEEMEDTVFPASWSGGTLTASGTVSITLRTFYEYDGQQFAVGEMALADGSSAVVGMIRP